ncbi:MAG: hypothetical protein JSU73_12070 [candidate division WOR-3 bacterium]|nr:MAG: hypothetical protein JSU73_12070 [candidate division WOR-3 bacterium]
MEQIRCRCIFCNGNETFASYFCERCIYNWEEEAYIDPDGTVQKSMCPMCMKATAAGQIRCNKHACMAVWAATDMEG